MWPLWGLVSPAFDAGGEGTADASHPASTLDLTYDLYVGGISLGKVGMSARFEGADYKAISTLGAKGIVNAFWQARIEGPSSSGQVNGGRVQPEVSMIRFRKTVPHRAPPTPLLTFDPDGPKTLASDPPYGENRYPVSETQRKQTLDPLSAAISLTLSSAAKQQKPCEAVAPIFDGRRRYDVAFNFVKKTDVHMDNGLYSGAALICEVHYNQIAGYQQERSGSEQEIPENVRLGDPGQEQLPTRTASTWVPIRVWAGDDYGVVVALASQAKLDLSQPLARAN